MYTQESAPKIGTEVVFVRDAVTALPHRFEAGERARVCQVVAVLEGRGDVLHREGVSVEVRTGDGRALISREEGLFVPADVPPELRPDDDDDS